VPSPDHRLGSFGLEAAGPSVQQSCRALAAVARRGGVGGIEEARLPGRLVGWADPDAGDPLLGELDLGVVVVDALPGEDADAILCE